MKYSEKDYIFLGKQVAAGRYVSRSVFALSLVLALLIGLCIGRYALPDAPAPAGQKRPLTQEGAASLTDNRQTLQSIFRHEEDVRKNPDNVEAWEHLGNLYFDAGEPQKAVNAYNRALELKPGNTSVLVDCGVMYRELKEYPKALEYFRKALEIDPKHEHALFNSGIVLYFDLKQKDEGLNAWRELLKVKPDARTPSGEPLSTMIDTLSRQ